MKLITPRIFVLALLMSVGCAQNIPGNSDNESRADNLGPDAGAAPDVAVLPIGEGSDAAVDAEPDAGEAVAPPTAITLRASASDTITASNSVICQNGTTLHHSDNRYYRVFDLQASGITGDLSVTSIEVGIEEAIGATGTQNMSVLVHTLNGVLLTSNLSAITATTIAVPDQAATVLTIPLPATVPVDSTMVIEVYVPNGQTEGNRLVVGSNRDVEPSPTYLVAPSCGIDQPSQTNTLGVDFVMSMVLNVNGEYQLAP